MGDAQQTNPFVGLLIAGAMFVIMGVVAIVIEMAVLAWSFLPMGAFLIMIWVINRPRASRDDD